VRDGLPDRKGGGPLKLCAELPHGLFIIP
jgi:hypothetical protein